MNGFGRPVKKEWLGFITFDKFYNIVSVIVGQPLSLSLFIGAEVFGSFFLWWLLCDLCKSNLEGALSFRANIPLADLAGDISIFAHKLSEGGAVSGYGKATGHSILAKALAVLPHHQGTSAWATGRVGDVGCGEAHPFLGQPVDVGSWDVRTVITTEISITKVINVNEHYIRLVQSV